MVGTKSVPTLLGLAWFKDQLLYMFLSMRNVCSLLGEPMPALPLLGQDRPQLELEV